MSLFSRLFSKFSQKAENKTNHKASPQAKTKTTGTQAEEMHFATNAADFGLIIDPISASGALRIDAILVISALTKYAKANHLEFNYKLLQNFFYKDRVFNITLTCKLGNKGYSFFFLYGADDVDNFATYEFLAQKTAYPNVIYFRNVRDRKHKTVELDNVLVDLDLRHLSYLEKEKIQGDFSLYHQGLITPFLGSKLQKLYLRLYQTLDGFESMFAGLITHQFNLIEDQKELSRIMLPEELVKIQLSAPNEERILLCMSKETGILPLFPANTSLTYREEFLEQFTNMLLSYRIALTAKEVEPDPQEYRFGLKFWKAYTQRPLDDELSNILLCPDEALVHIKDDKPDFYPIPRIKVTESDSDQSADIDLPAESQPCFKTIGSNLNMFFAHDKGTHYVFMNQKELDESDYDIEQLKELAFENMWKEIGNLPVRMMTTAGVTSVAVNQDLEPGLIFCEKIRSSFHEKFGDSVAFSVPNRGCLLVCDPNDPEAVFSLEKQTREKYNHTDGPRPLSLHLYIIDQKGKVEDLEKVKVDHYQSRKR